MGWDVLGGRGWVGVLVSVLFHTLHLNSPLTPLLYRYRRYPTPILIPSFPPPLHITTTLQGFKGSVRSFIYWGCVVGVSFRGKNGREDGGRKMGRRGEGGSQGEEDGKTGGREEEARTGMGAGLGKCKVR